MKYEMLTFVHIFPSCSQDSCAVIAVMADVVKQLKEVMPTLTSVYYRQDNAACYHWEQRSPVVSSCMTKFQLNALTFPTLREEKDLAIERPRPSNRI